MIEISKNYRKTLEAIREDFLNGENNFIFTFSARPKNLPRACYMCISRIDTGIKIEKDVAEYWLCSRCFEKMVE